MHRARCFHLELRIRPTLEAFAVAAIVMACGLAAIACLQLSAAVQEPVIGTDWCCNVADVHPAVKHGRRISRSMFEAQSRPVLREALLTPGFTQRFHFRCF